MGGEQWWRRVIPLPPLPLIHAKVAIPLAAFVFLGRSRLLGMVLGGLLLALAAEQLERACLREAEAAVELELRP